MSCSTQKFQQGHRLTPKMGFIGVHKISSVELYRALSFDRPFLDPNCSSVNMLLSFKKSVFLQYVPSKI